MMTDETTTEQLAEIEGQADGITPDDVAAQQLVRGLVLQVAAAIEQQETVEQPQPVQIREGRWRTRGGEVKYIKAGGSRRDNHYSWPWTDTLMCWQDNGCYHASKPSENDLVEYLGPIKPEPEPQPEPEKIITPDDVAAEAINEWPSVKILRQEMEATELALLEQQQRNEQLVTQGSQQYMKIQELRSEVSYVQGLLGDERRRFAELETLTSDLRAVNAATEKAMNSAARDKADLQHRLDVVSKAWAEQAGTINGLRAQLDRRDAQIRDLQIELDTLQQVPADSPELRQLRADLAEVTLDRDTYRDGYDRVLSDLRTIKETTKAETVEAIAEWLQPIRAVDNEHLANETLQHLPHIMRTLTGLDSHAID